MKTKIKDIIYYYKDSAYVYVDDLQIYAREQGIGDESAMNDIEGYLSDYDLIEEEPDGRLVFHKIKKTNK